MTALRTALSRDGLAAMWTNLPLRVFGFALVLTFVEPLNRGMPIGTRQLGRLVSPTAVSILRAASTFAYLATFALAGLWMLWSFRKIRRSQPIFFAVALIGLGVAVGVATGILGESPPRNALEHGQFVVPYVLAVGLPVATELEWRRLLFALRVGFTLPAVYSLFILLVNGGSQPLWYTRIIPNGISFSGAACIMWLAHARYSGRWWNYVFAALCAGGVFISGARGWILALVVALGVYVVVSRRGRGRIRRRFAIGAGLASAAAAGVILQLGLLDSLVTRTTRATGGLRDRRIEQAKNLYAEWTDSPFFGSGLGYQNPALARRPDIIYEGPRPYLAELSYPNLLAKMGLIGFGLLAAGLTVMLIYLYRCAKRTAPDPTVTGLFAAAIYLLLSSLLNPTFESVFLHTFMALAMFGTLTYAEQRPGDVGSLRSGRRDKGREFAPVSDRVRLPD